jgi:membrane protein
MTALFFTFFLMFMPNTKVRGVPGLTGGMVAALLFFVWLWACAALQVGVAKWGRIYGSLATLPILLAWVYVSWQIVFFGAETAFAVQHCTTYRMEHGARVPNVEARLALALAVVVEAGRAVINGGGTFNTTRFAAASRVPVRLLNDVVTELVRSGLLGELSDSPGIYALLKSPDRLTVGDVIRAVMSAGTDPKALGLARLDTRLRDVAARVCRQETGITGSMPIRTLIEGEPAGG